MSDHASAEGYIESLGPAVKLVARAAHACFVGRGCASYVKTIYVGYTIGSEMVAAMYAHPDRVEVALALAEDADSALLVDASHLTWRTLPLAAVLRSEADIRKFGSLVAEAVARVENEEHDVERSNEFFARRARQRGILRRDDRREA